MAISNKFGLMVVTTGNKSEMSVGYATLYGDMNGGFNPIKDLYKTEVFRLSRLRNAWKPEGALGPDGEVIPENVIVKPPTAELRENQKDQDSLPPYDMLDQILERLVEREEPIATIVAAGFDRDIVLKVERLLASRRIQAAAGGARRQGDAEEFRPRPPLSDRQSLPRQRRAVAGAGPHAAQGRRVEQDRSLRFLKLKRQRAGMKVGPTARTLRLGSGLDGSSARRCSLRRQPASLLRERRPAAGLRRPRIGLGRARAGPA